jgi:hypoxanthine phosphoribosyltransferase
MCCTEHVSRGSKILIIDDINDSGATFNHIAENCIYDSNIRYAAVINNRPSAFEVNYYGYEIDKSVEDRGWYFHGKNGTNNCYFDK